jgi:formate dehydrogenase major subunit/formate dehydrogenase alpha subunit
MVIQTESPKLTRHRRFVLEMLLSNYYDYQFRKGQIADLGDNQFSHWVKVYGLDIQKTTRKLPQYPVDIDPNPFVQVDYNKCILCTRCVRACAEIQGRFVWSIGGRGYDAHPVAGADVTMLEADCESCGACVAYCPTGALSNKMSHSSGKADRIVTTTCTYCGVGCQYDLNVKDGKVIRVTSNPDAPVNGMALCVKGRYGYDFIHHPDRLLKPMVRRYLLEGKEKPPADVRRPLVSERMGKKGLGKRAKELNFSSAPPAPVSLSPDWDWVETDWDTALTITANQLRSARDQWGPDSIGVLTSAKCLNEENYLMNKLARQVLGTNNIDHCARL